MSSWRTRALAYLESKLEEGDRLILERVLQERATAVAIPVTGSSSPASEVSPQRRLNPLSLTKGAWNQFCGRWWRELGAQKVVASDLLELALVDPAFAELLGSKSRASQLTRLAAEITPRVGLRGLDFMVELAGRGKSNFYRLTHLIDPETAQSLRGFITAPGVIATSPVSQATVHDSVPSQDIETSNPRPKPWLSGWRMPERQIGQPWEDWIRSGLSTLPALTLDHIRLDLDKVILCVRDRELGPLKLGGRYGVSPATVAVALTECEPLIRAMDGMPEGSQYKFLEILRKQLQGVK